MLWHKASIRSIAEALKRSPSSVSREIRRNKPPKHNQYAPRVAHERALSYRKHRGNGSEDPMKTRMDSSADSFLKALIFGPYQTRRYQGSNISSTPDQGSGLAGRRRIRYSMRRWVLHFEFECTSLVYAIMTKIPRGFAVLYIPAYYFPILILASGSSTSLSDSQSQQQGKRSGMRGLEIEREMKAEKGHGEEGLLWSSRKKREHSFQ